MATELNQDTTCEATANETVACSISALSDKLQVQPIRRFTLLHKRRKQEAYIHRNGRYQVHIWTTRMKQLTTEDNGFINLRLEGMNKYTFPELTLK
jgi:hypothetical protein